MPVIDGSEEVVKVPCIYYPVQFQEGQKQEDQRQIRVLLDSGSEINAINPAFAWKLGLYIQKNNVGAQKIDSSALKIFRIIIADFQVEDKNGRPRFF